MKVWIYWGLQNTSENRSLLAIFTHHPTINETNVFAKRCPHYDYILSEFETVPDEDHNENLYEKLKKLLPPEPEDKTATWTAKINFKPDPIRSGAEAFFRYLGGELPRNDRELLDILYVFGKFMFKEMDRQTEYWRKVASDALYLDTRPIYVNKEDVCLTPTK